MDGAQTYFSVQTTKRLAHWGDPGLYWGLTDLVWGGVVTDPDSRSYILKDSNMTIDQRIEPEQGRGSTSTMSFSFLDKNGEVTRFFTPGQVVDEPLGRPLVKVKVGYADSTFPEDYFTVFRGFVSSIKSVATKTIIQLSDPNVKRRQQIFFQAKTTLSSGIDDTTTTIPATSTEDFYQEVLGPDGSYDTGITPYIKIGDEFMSYGPSDVGESSFTVTRGARDTTAEAHNVDDEISAFLEIGPENPIDIALKIMLSGWEGPWKEDQEILSIQQTNTDLGIVANAIVLPLGVDGVDDLGITAGDYWTFSGSTEGNDGEKIVEGVQDLDGRLNALVTFTEDFANPEEDNTSLVASIRSKYDVYPVNASSRLTPEEVDISAFEEIRDTWFFDTEMQFLITQEAKGKDFIEKEIMLPLGAYSVTRRGKISMTITQPPVVDSNVQTLSIDNIIDPKTISVERATNNRRYFNEIQYQYDITDSGNFQSKRIILDSESLSNISISSVLPIDARGLKSSLQAENIIDSRGSFLINRYSNVALYLECKVNWKVGSVIETGNAVILRDEGELKIANYATGERNLGTVIFEVISCKKDPKTGVVSLGLLSGTGFYAEDRYGTIAPSSLIVPSDCTTSQIKIQDSFGARFPGNEKKKWEPIIGELISVHSSDYGYEYIRTLTGFLSTDRYMATISPELPILPSDGWSIDVAPYPTDTSLTLQQQSKLFFASWSATVYVVSGISETEIEVYPSDIGNFLVGGSLFYRNTSYSVISTDSIIQDVDTINNIVTVSAFDVFPSDGGWIEGLGFLDGTKSYVYV